MNAKHPPIPFLPQKGKGPLWLRPLEEAELLLLQKLYQDHYQLVRAALVAKKDSSSSPESD